MEIELSFDSVRQRSAEVIGARGASSAANAVINLIKSIIEPTPDKEWPSIGVPRPTNTVFPKVCNLPFLSEAMARLGK